jgi:hypothetical protein
VEYLQSQHGSPLEALLKIGLAPLPIVAVELGKAWDDLDSKQRLELWKAQLSALQACLPYMHQKLRPDVTINDMRATQVVLSYGGGQAIAGQQDRETLTIDVGDVGDGAA